MANNNQAPADTKSEAVLYPNQALHSNKGLVIPNHRRPLGQVQRTSGDVTLGAWRKAPTPPRTTSPTRLPRGIVKDENASMMTKEAFKAAFGGLGDAAAVFERLDQNHDGAVDAAEFAEVYGSVDEDNIAEAPGLFLEAHATVRALRESGRHNEATELERIINQTEVCVDEASEEHVESGDPIPHDKRGLGPRGVSMSGTTSSSMSPRNIEDPELQASVQQCLDVARALRVEGKVSEAEALEVLLTLTPKPLTLTLTRCFFSA